MLRWLVRILVGAAAWISSSGCPLPESLSFAQVVVTVPDALCAPGDVCLLCDGLSLSNVDHVELAPAFTYTHPGASFLVQAVPVLANGLPVRGVGITVTWPTVPFLNVVAPDARVDVPLGAPAQEVTGVDPKVAGRSPIAPGSVRVGAPAGRPAGGVLEATHTPGAPPEGVLIHWPPLPPSTSAAAADPSCDKEGSMPFAMAEAAHLEVPLSDGCAKDIAIFTANQGALLLGWKSDQTVADSPLLPPPPPRSVTVYVRTDQAEPTDPSSFPAAVASASAIADRLYSVNRTGIAFDWINQLAEPDLVWPAASLTSPTTPFPYKCDDDALSSELGVPVTGADAPAGGRLSQHELYVVFVPSIENAVAGFICDRTPRRGPAIVMSTAHFNPTTLSHELAHAFGMENEIPSFGHTEGEPGFTPASLMWGAPDVCTGRSRERLSLGQMYRMNFDSGSWLRHQALVDSVVECTPSWGEGSCPAVHMDFPRGMD